MGTSESKSARRMGLETERERESKGERRWEMDVEALRVD